MKHINRVSTLLCAYALLHSSSGLAIDTSPIAVRNSLPVYEGAGLSTPKSALLIEDASFELSLAGNIESHANDSGSEFETLIIDGESHSLALSLSWGFAPSWQASLDIRGLRNTSGNLDSAIDAWHSLFSLDSGDRDQQEEDQLLILYRNNLDDNGDSAAIRNSNSGLADTQLTLSRQLHSTLNFNLALHGAINLATGKASQALGSDTADASLVLAASGRGQAFGWHANLGALAIGDQTLFSAQTKSSTWLTSLGAHWQPSDSWRWSAQIDGHGPVFASTIKELEQNAWQLALAGEWRHQNGAVQAYFSEDISVNSAADFAFGIRYTHKLR